ncbi:polymorphic toxin-type HINT domain-containing protein [Oxalobacteraceae bacterium OTU3CAMAD1]|nr:polymorphic toxin-type HINT domain-containing protein [Oxalobacteraceae bacterium OTU3CAMAD1]
MMKNTGDVNWNAGSEYVLVSLGDNWGVTSINMPDFVPPGDPATFNFNIKAPAVSGVYSYKWQLRKNGAAFGSIVSQQITVNPVGTNTPPTAAWITPQISSVKYWVTTGAKAAVQLSAAGRDNDPGGSVTSMQVFRNGETTPLLDRAGASFNESVLLGAGTYNLYAQAKDNFGAVGKSGLVEIRVLEPSGSVRFNSVTPSSLTGVALAGNKVTSTIAYKAETVDPEFWVEKVELMRVGTSTPLASRNCTIQRNANNEPIHSICDGSVSYDFAIGTHDVFLRATMFSNIYSNSAQLRFVISENAAPTASISVPVKNYVVAANTSASVPMTLSGSDVDGIVKQLTLYRDGALAASGPASSSATAQWPTSLTLPVGQYNLQARAIDNFNVSSPLSAGQIVKISPNTLPTASLSVVGGKLSYKVPPNGQASVSFSGTISDSDGTVRRWDIVEGAGSLAFANVNSATVAVSQTLNFVKGEHQIRLKAIDNLGEISYSAPIVITVTEDDPNVKPTATMTAPTLAKSYSVGINGTVAVTVSGWGSDTDGWMSRMEVLRNGVSQAGVSGSTIDHVLTLESGQHDIAVRAIDNAGGFSDSTAVRITVNAANGGAQISDWMATPNGGVVTSTGTLPVRVSGTAIAATSDDAVQRVEVWDDISNKLLDASNYTLQWSAGHEVPINTVRKYSMQLNLTPGDYSLYFRAATYNGGTGQSAKLPVKITSAAGAPAVQMTSPVESGIYEVTAGDTAPVTIIGSASAANGIKVLEVIDNDAVIDSMTTAEVNKTYQLSAGPHRLVLRVVDNQNNTMLSAAALITVLESNAKILFTSPANGLKVVMPWGGTVAKLSVTGSVQAGSAAVIKFHGMLDNVAACELSVTGVSTCSFNAALGAHELRLRATDKNGRFTFSEPRNVTVVPTGAAHTITLSAPLANSVINTNLPTAPVRVRGVVSSPSGPIVSYDILDSYTKIGEGTGGTIDQVVELAPGAHALMIRSTDSVGVEWLWASRNVTVVSSTIMGGLAGVRIEADGTPQLVGWACQKTKADAVTYEVYVNAAPDAGGTLLGSGSANIATELNNATIASGCGTPNAGHHFKFDLSPFVTQYPGSPLFVKASLNGEVALVPCEENLCTMPNSMRVGLTTPLTGDRFFGTSTVFSRLQISTITGTPDEVAFNIDGEWITGQPDAAAGAYYASKVGLAPRAAPYIVFGRVRQGNVTLNTVESQFYVMPSNGVTLELKSPANVAIGAPIALTAAVGGTSAGATTVLFYANGVLIGTGNVAADGVASTSWATNVAGRYNIFAIAVNQSSARVAQSNVTILMVGTTANGASSPDPLPVSVSTPHLGNANAGTLPGSLTVSPAGGANYGIEIAVPPGTAGLQPQLSLNYDSQGQNSLLGVGWTLGGLSSIHRCGKTIAQDEVNARIAFSTNDRLCLDGQRLVLVNLALSDASYWADNAEYRTEIDNFSRITAQSTSGRRSFKVETRDGRVMLFGAADGFEKAIVQPVASSRDATTMPAEKSGPVSWKLDKVTDRYGNFIDFSYEQNATSGEHRPSVIRYGGNGQAAHAAVEFGYESRADAWTRYTDEARTDLRNRIKSITTYVGDNLGGIVSNGTKVRSYALAYERSPSSGRSLLTSVQVCANHPQTSVSECLPATRFDWGKPAAGKQAGFERIADWAGAPRLSYSRSGGASGYEHHMHSEYFAFMDMENHGYTDMLEKQSSPLVSTPATFPNAPVKMPKYRYFHNNGAGGFTSYFYELSTKENFQVVDLADFNGDGAPDLYVTTDNGLKICLSPLAKPGALMAAGSTLSFDCRPELKTTGLISSSNMDIPFITDILGDGRAALYSRVRLDGTATLCIQTACQNVANPPLGVLGATYANDGSPEYARSNYTTFTEMVDYTGVGKPYDTRWTKAHFVDTTNEEGIHIRRWDAMTPTVSMLDVQAPGVTADAAPMLPYLYRRYSQVGSSAWGQVDARVPYKFDESFAGLGHAGDFNGTGYSGLAYGFLEYAWLNNTASYSKAEMTVCLSTGRALDCRVRQKFSGPRYHAVRGVGNFTGDGQPSILVERMNLSASPLPEWTGDLLLCRVMGDDVSTQPDGADDGNIACDPISGINTKNRGNNDTVRVFLMDLLGTGRTQVVRYVETATSSALNPTSIRWEVYRPIDVAESGQSLDRIHRVTNGLGAYASVEYQDGRTTNLVRHSGTVSHDYPRHLSSGVGKYVSRLVVGNGAGSDRSWRYAYQDPAIDVSGRGSLGFAQMTVTDEQLQHVTTTTYAQTWPLTGSVLSTKVEAANGIVLSNTENRMKEFKIAQANGKQTSFVASIGGTVARRDLSGADLGTTTTTGASGIADVQYDSWGNVTHSMVTATSSVDGDRFVTSTVNGYYAPDAANFTNSLLRNSSVNKWQSSNASSITRTVDYTYETTGQLKSETIQSGDTSKLMKLTTEYDRAGNAFGLVTLRKVTWHDPIRVLDVSKSETMKYDSRGRYVESATNALTQTQTFAFDAGTGARTRLTDTNGLVTTWLVDGFGSIQVETRPDKNEKRQYRKQCDGTCPGYAASATVIEQYNGASRTAAPQVMYADSVGHEVGARTWGFDGRPIFAGKRYDTLGRLKEADQPSYDASAVLDASYEYDELGRVKATTKYGDGIAEVTSTTYAGLTITHRNAKTHQRVERRDILGRTVSVTDALNGKTGFAYDAAGNLVQTLDPLGNAIGVRYDDLGRKIELNDPDLGRVLYTVDALGQVRKQTSKEQAKNSQFTRMDYDSLGRLVARVEGNLDARWIYDAQAGADCKTTVSCGQLVEAYTGPPASKTYRRLHAYNALGLPVETKQTINLVVFRAGTVYDSWSRPVTQTYQREGGAEKIFDLRYNQFGYLQRVERGPLVLWTVTAQDAAQRVTSQLLGNGLVSQQAFDPGSGRVKSLSLQKADKTLRWSEGYDYDKLGSVTLRTQVWGDARLTEGFQYDELGRLRFNTIDGGQREFRYDAGGNITYKQDLGVYTYLGDGKSTRLPHAVLSIAGIPGTFEYDDNGNLLRGAGRVVTWSSFDMPLTIARGTDTAAFAYGPELQRTRQTRNDGMLIYAGAQEVETKAGETTVKTYWPFGLGVEIDRPGVAAPELNWMHKDRLGSVTALSDVDGNLREALAYDPWGKRRNRADSGTPDALDGKTDNRGFTGHEMLDALDLVHMNGRVYDPLVGRFMSADPFIQDPYNGQNYSRYSYVMNNPTNMIDPTGFVGSRIEDQNKEKAEKEAEKVGKACAGAETCNVTINGKVTVTIKAGQISSIKPVLTASNDNKVNAKSRESTANEAGGLSGMWKGITDHFKSSWDSAKSSLRYHLDNPLDIVSDTLDPFGGASGPKALVGLGSKLIQTAGTAEKVIDACCCFPAGTPVSTDQGMIAIEKIKVGQLVYSRDPQTGETAFKPVTQLMVTRAKPLFRLVTENYAGHLESMEVTDNHPYWVKGMGWVDAEKLTTNSLLQSLDGQELKVVSLEKLGRSEVTYNFTVADFHTYFAGSQKAFVHNCSGCKLAEEAVTSLSKIALGAPAKMQDHHLLPQQFDRFFAQRGIDIHAHTVTISSLSHLKGLHGAGLGNMPGGWNQQWGQWIANNPNATTQQIYQNLGQMMVNYNISHLPIHSYRK